MEQSDRIAFDGFLVKVGEFYNEIYSSDRRDMFFNVLIGYPLEAIALAFHAHMGDPDKGMFPPMPADITRIIKGGANVQALTAWDTALETVRERGAYATVTFDDPLIAWTIDKMGGWPHFCAMRDDDVDDEGRFIRGDKDLRQKQFVERYTALLNLPPSGPAPILLGITEQQNARFPADFRALEMNRVARGLPPVKATDLNRLVGSEEDRAAAQLVASSEVG